MDISKFVKRKATITIKDSEGNEKDILLTGLTLTDIEERNKIYDEVFRDSIKHAREMAETLVGEIDAMSDQGIRNFVFKMNMGSLASEIDLIDIENSDVLSKEEISKKQEEEAEKIANRLKEESQVADIGELRNMARIYVIRMQQILKFNELMEAPSLVFVAKDPETQERIFSLDPKSDKFIGNLDAEILMEMLDKSIDFREQIDAIGLRRLMEDPNFLLLSPSAASAE